jgi:hypothetical protein
MRILLSLLLLSSLSSWAQTPVEEDCNNDLKVCRYYSQNFNPQLLIQKINQVLNNERAFRGDNTFLVQEAGLEKVIMYWVDENTNTKIANLLRLFDAPEHYKKNKIIEVTANIYEMAESSVRNIGAEISRLSLDGFSSDNTPVTNGFQFGLKIGKADLGGVIAIERAKRKIKNENTAGRPVFNNEAFDLSQTTTHYLAPGMGSSINMQESGIRMSGVAAYDEKNEKILLKNFSLNYGVVKDPDGKIDNNGNIEIVSFPSTDILLDSNMAYPIVSLKSIGEMKYDRFGFILGRNEKTAEAVKLVIYISAQVYEYDDYNAKLTQYSEKKDKFTNDDLQGLRKDCLKEVDFLSDMKLIAERASNGDPLLFIQLKKENVCESQVKDWLKIKINGSDFKSEVSRTVENLTLLPYRIDNIPLIKMSGEKDVEFKITLKMERSGSSVTRKVKFTPTTDDISENFRFR